MNKFLLMVLCIFTVSSANAQVTTYLDEAKGLGAAAGQGLACGASKYETFEMLSRAIIVTKATSDRQQAEGMYAYNDMKANAYMSKQMDAFFDCPNISRRFDNQEIFNITLYADGSMRMPDGQILTPRQPYDATMLFRQNPKEREEAQAIYDKGKDVRVGEVTLRTAGEAPVKFMPPNAVKAPSTKRR